MLSFLMLLVAVVGGTFLAGLVLVGAQVLLGVAELEVA